jgi:hypothetical protein
MPARMEIFRFQKPIDLRTLGDVELLMVNRIRDGTYNSPAAEGNNVFLRGSDI